MNNLDDFDFNDLNEFYNFMDLPTENIIGNVGNADGGDGAANAVQNNNTDLMNRLHLSAHEAATLMDKIDKEASLKQGDPFPIIEYLSVFKEMGFDLEDSFELALSSRALNFDLLKQIAESLQSSGATQGVVVKLWEKICLQAITDNLPRITIKQYIQSVITTLMPQPSLETLERIYAQLDKPTSFIDYVNSQVFNPKSKLNAEQKAKFTEGLLQEEFGFTEEQVKTLLTAHPTTLKSLILNWEDFIGLGFTATDSVAAITSCRYIDFDELKHVKDLWHFWISKGMPQRDILPIITNGSASYHMENLSRVYVALGEKIQSHIQNGKLASITLIDYIKWIASVSGRPSGVCALEKVSYHLDNLVAQGCTLEHLKKMCIHANYGERIVAFLSLSKNAPNIFALQQRVDIVSYGQGHYAANALEEHHNKLIKDYGFTADEIGKMATSRWGAKQIEAIVAFSDALNACLMLTTSEDAIAVFSTYKKDIIAHFESNDFVAGRVSEFLSATKIEHCTADEFLKTVFEATRTRKRPVIYSNPGNNNHQTNNDIQSSSKKMKM